MPLKLNGFFPKGWANAELTTDKTNTNLFVSILFFVTYFNSGCDLPLKCPHGRWWSTEVNHKIKEKEQNDDCKRH